MNPRRAWLGFVLVALGVVGVMDATGTLELSRTVDQWWPLAVVGYGLADMLTDRRISLGGTAIVAIGLALLADAQEWVSNDNIVWDTLLVFIGLAILFGRGKEHGVRGEDRLGSSADPAPGGSIRTTALEQRFVRDP